MLDGLTTVLSRVALFTRAWIEIELRELHPYDYRCRPLHEGVD